MAARLCREHTAADSCSKTRGLRSRSAKLAQKNIRLYYAGSPGRSENKGREDSETAHGMGELHTYDQTLVRELSIVYTSEGRKLMVAEY